MASTLKQLSESLGIEMGARRNRDWFVPLMLLGIAAYLFANLFVLPAIPFLLSGDQTFFWTDAQRMLYGEQPYRDFFQFTPPGTDLVYFSLFKVFGPRIWVTNAVVLLLGLSLCWVCFSIARQMMDRHLALLATLLFLTLIYARLLNATHHWFSVLAILLAARIAISKTSATTIFAVGALLGLASFFTQTHGAAAMLAFSIFLLWERYRGRESWRGLLRYQFLLVLGFAIVLLTLSGYFLAAIGVKQLWHYQVTFVYRYMVHRPGGWFLGLPELPTWRRLPLVGQYLFVYLLLFTIYPPLLIRSWLARRDLAFRLWRPVTLLCLVGSALAAEVIFNLNWLRAYTVSMPAIVLLVWLISTTGKTQRYAVTLVWIGVVCMALELTWSRHRHEYLVAEFPAGVAAVAPGVYEKLHWITGHTQPGQFLFQTTAQTFYLPLELRNPVYAETIAPDEQTRPEYVERTIQELEIKKVHYLLWSPEMNHVDLGSRSEDNLGPLRAYVRNQYNRVQVFSDQEEVLERK
jgi:hypothetical protein